MQAPDALTLAVGLGKVLEAAHLPYAIGGALALGIHGVSRSTQDVDINVFVPADRLEELLTVLEGNGVKVDKEKAKAEGASEGVFFCWAGNTRIDVFLASIELSWEALRTRVAANVQGTSTWFLSAESLSCFKLLFFRPKDLMDLERLVATSPVLDAARVRALMVETMGHDDERIKAWDDIVRRFLPA